MIELWILTELFFGKRRGRIYSTRNHTVDKSKVKCCLEACGILFAHFPANKSRQMFDETPTMFERKLVCGTNEKLTESSFFWTSDIRNVRTLCSHPFFYLHHSKMLTETFFGLLVNKCEKREKSVHGQSQPERIIIVHPKSSRQLQLAQLLSKK